MRKAFTLIELMVVISVIAILATIALFGFGRAQSAARDVSRAQIMNGIQGALTRYYGDKGRYPTEVDAMNFGTMFGELSSGGYLGRASDPKSGCQALAAQEPTAAATWTPCTLGNLPSYVYTNATNAYSLILWKESGGSQTFKSPQ